MYARSITYCAIYGRISSSFRGTRLKSTLSIERDSQHESSSRAHLKWIAAGWGLRKLGCRHLSGRHKSVILMNVAEVRVCTLLTRHTRINPGKTNSRTQDSSGVLYTLILESAKHDADVHSDNKRFFPDTDVEHITFFIIIMQYFAIYLHDDLHDDVTQCFN